MELSPMLYHWIIRPNWYTKLYANRLRRYLDGFDFTHKKVLDFGCGVGSNCSMFDPKHYVGIDCNPQRIQYGQNLYRDYTFIAIEDNHLPFKNESLDFVLIMAVLHHMPSKAIQLSLQQFKKVLRPHGKIIIIEPCLFPKSSFNNRYMNFFDKGHYIRSEKDYLDLFHKDHYHTQVIKRFRKCLFYNELFFLASPHTPLDATDNS